MAFLPDFAGGHALPQVYCRSVYHSDKSDPPPVQFTDDVLLQGPRSNLLLRLLVIVDDMEQLEQAWSELSSLNIGKASSGELKEDTAFFLVNSPSVSIRQPNTSSTIPQQSVFRIATGEEFAMSPLCRNRPPPIGYDMYLMKEKFKGRKFVLVRPDRFVFAACRTGDELVSACERISQTLFQASGARPLLSSQL